MDGLNWFWIVLGATAPVVLAVLAAIPFWRRGQSIFGSLVGTGIVFASAIALILREYVELDRLEQACYEAGTVCFPEPSAFTRFAIHAFIGLLEVFALFILSLKADEHRRRRDYAPEWR